MPLEQLLAQYGYVLGGNENTTTTGDDAPEPSARQHRQKMASQPAASSAERPAKRRRTVQLSPSRSCASDGQGHLTEGRSSSPAVGSRDGSADLQDLLLDPEADSAADDVRAAKGKAVAGSSGGMSSTRAVDRNGSAVGLPDDEIDELDGGHSESEDFDSAAGSDAGDDNEQTLEEEERMATAEGAAQSVSLCLLQSKQHCLLPALLCNRVRTAFFCCCCCCCCQAVAWHEHRH